MFKYACRENTAHCSNMDSGGRVAAASAPKCVTELLCELVLLILSYFLSFRSLRINARVIQVNLNVMEENNFWNIHPSIPVWTWFWFHFNICSFWGRNKFSLSSEKYFNFQHSVQHFEFNLKPTCGFNLIFQINVKSNTWGFLQCLLLPNLFGGEVAHKMECAANWNLARQLAHFQSARTSSVSINVHLSRLMTLILKND